MGKQPVRMKAVVYALSPFQQKIMSGLWKDLPSKIHHKISENWISAALLLSPLVGTYTLCDWFLSSYTARLWRLKLNRHWANLHLMTDGLPGKDTLKGDGKCSSWYVQNYQEKEKLAHRY